MLLSFFIFKNVRFETKPLESNDTPFRKSVSGYKSSNTAQNASAYKLTASKCIFCIYTENDHDIKSHILNLENKILFIFKQ